MLPNELFLTARQKTKIKNAFARNSNMLMDIKLSKAKISKRIQTGGFLSNMVSGFANLGKTWCKKAITDLPIP